MRYKATTKRMLGSVAIAVGMVAVLSAPAAYAQSSRPAPSPFVVTTSSPVQSMGTISASLVPMSKVAPADTKVAPADSSGGNGEVTITLIGEGLYLDYWIMTAGPIEPGECVFGAYWAPPNSIFELGPELCNTTGGAVQYVGYLSDVSFSGDVEVCNTAVGYPASIPGKPCEEVYG